MAKQLDNTSEEPSTTGFDDSVYDALYEATAEDEMTTTFGELSTCGDRYRDAKEIGIGGMKRVNNVFDSASERRLAMAELREDMDQSFDEALLREARLTALLDHPNVISVHEIGLTPENRVFFTMDLKPGESLDKVLAGHRENNTDDFPVDERLRIFAGVCDAVAFAHSKHVVHLDVKPANVQVGKFGEVLLCDWGLAKILDREDEEDTLDLLGSVSKRRDVLNGMTSVGRIKGTPGYMAPEQVEKNGVKNEQTDVFSLGCFLYALCTLQRPFSGTAEQIMERTRKGEPEPIPANVPVSLAAVIRKAMATEKRDRYSSVTALKQEVDNYRRGHSTVAENASMAKELLLFARRNKRSVSVACSALCAITLLSLIYVENLQTKNQALLAAKQTAETAQTVAEQERDAAEKSRLAAMRANKEIQTLHLQEIQSLMNRQVFVDHPRGVIGTAITMWEVQRQVHGDTPEIMAGFQECLFVSGRFYSTIKIEPLNKNMRIMRAIAERYVDLKRDAPSAVYKYGRTAKISADALRDIALELAEADMYSVALKFLLCDASQPGHQDYYPAALGLFAFLNPDWDPTTAEYSPENGTLQLSGRAFKHLTTKTASYLSPLRLLHVKHLDLSGSGVTQVEGVSRLNLYSIDLRDTTVTDLKPLRWTSKLERVIVEKGRFGEGDRKVSKEQLIEK